jgi:hypothetical protein
MCPTHVKAGRTRWPTNVDWPTLCKQCEPCRLKSSGLAIHPKILPDLTEAEHDTANAIHEAGHAVVALVLGMPLESVEIWRAGEGGHKQDGGYTKFDENQWNPFTDRVFPQLWAGQEATDRWLTELGYGTDENQFDLRFMAKGDAIDFDRRVAEEGLNVPSDAGIGEARKLVSAHWRKVTALASALVIRRRMSADEVRHLVDGIVG